MRTTLDLPDPLFRTLKARAAMDGSSLKDLLVRLVQRGLAVADGCAPAPLPRSPLPVLVAGPLALTAEQMSHNTALYAVMDTPADERAIALPTGAPAPLNP